MVINTVYLYTTVAGTKALVRDFSNQGDPLYINYPNHGYIYMGRSTHDNRYPLWCSWDKKGKRIHLLYSTEDLKHFISLVHIW